MRVTVPFSIEVEPTDPSFDDTFRTLRARANLRVIENGGGPYETLSVAQAVALLIEQSAEMPEGISGWANDDWDSLVTDEDPAEPVPHIHQLYQSMVGGIAAVGWTCACGEAESPRYAKNEFAEAAHARHAATVTTPA